MPLPDRLLPDALACLRRIADMAPGPAKEELAGLRRRHPGVRMRLVWERDAPGGSYHYDLLVTTAGGTVSLAFAPDRALPWPLRGSHHTSEQVLLRVNGMEVTMEHAVAVLDVLWTDPSLAARLVDASLVEQELALDPVELPAAELQQALDAFRRARGLLTVEATREWMAERGLDHGRLEEVVAAEAAVARLRARVAGDRVEEVFAASPGDYDRLSVLALRYPDPAAAREGAVRLAGAGPGEDALALAAREALEHGARGEVRLAYRGDLGPRAATARAGDLLGPSGHEPSVTRVLEARPAALDGPTRGEIEKRIFEQWLAGRRREAGIEWMWGTAPRTDALTRALRRQAPDAVGV